MHYFHKELSIFILLPLLLSCNGNPDESNRNNDQRFVLNNSDWKDTENNPILAHDGGISLFNGTYYWYGSNYSGNPGGKYGVSAFNDGVLNGINVYSSTDLVTWKYEGIALQNPGELEGSDRKGSIGRPHVLFNKRTGKYVMWFFFFAEKFPDIIASVAVSDNPAGPFSYMGTVETGSPAITGARVAAAEQRSDAPAGCAGDLNVFADEDGRAYLVYDDGLRNIRVDRLSDDYLSSTGETVIALPAGNERHEAPAMTSHQGRYILAGSGVHGWGPSPTHYAIADDPMGPYSSKKALTPKTKLNTWNAQITSFFHIPESGRLIAMCDQWWIPDINDMNRSRYLWLEVVYHEDLDEFEMIYSDTLFLGTAVAD